MSERNEGGMKKWDLSTQVRDIYQGKLELARAEDEEAAKVFTHKFAQDPLIQSEAATVRERALAKKLVEAARYIIRLVDTTDPAVLRTAVSPESLKDVLLRGDAGVEVLMRVSEGQEEFRAQVESFRTQSASLRARTQSLRGGAIPEIAFKSIFRAIDEALAPFPSFELPEWNASQARRYGDAVRAFRQMFLRVEEELRKLESAHLAALPSSKASSLEEKQAESLTPRQLAERAFARLKSKGSASSQNSL